MGFVKKALGMIEDATTGGLASGIGSFVSGLFGGGGIGYRDQKKWKNSTGMNWRIWIIKRNLTKRWRRETKLDKTNTSE